MITVKITKTTSTPYEETVNFITEKIAAGTKDNSYGKEPVYSEKYAPSVAKKIKTEEVSLLVQNIEDDAAFDLAAVIVAINKLQ